MNDARHTRLPRAVDIAIRTLVPIVLALVFGGVIIGVMGVDPFAFYRDIVSLGLLGDGWQKTLTALAPLLVVGLGLIVAFRAQLWNLGYTGAYLFAAAVVAGISPVVFAALPFALAVLTVSAAAIGVGGALGVLPAWLKARHGTNEIVTSLMVSFIAVGLANLLVRGPFKDPAVQVPQTRVLAIEHMLPYIPGTRVHVGFLVAMLMVIAFHALLTRSSFGLKIDVLGASPRAAVHAGINVKRLIVVVFLLSTGMIAFAGALDMLGLWGYMRTSWNPGYGDKILPFVFLARLNPLGSVPLIAFYAVLATGGTIAAQRAGLSVDFLLVIVALILFFMTIIEFFGTRRDLGRSYLPRGLVVRRRQKTETAK